MPETVLHEQDLVRLRYHIVWNLHKHGVVPAVATGLHMALQDRVGNQGCCELLPLMLSARTGEGLQRRWLSAVQQLAGLHAWRLDQNPGRACLLHGACCISMACHTAVGSCVPCMMCLAACGHTVVLCRCSRPMAGCMGWRSCGSCIISQALQAAPILRHVPVSCSIGMSH